MRLSWRRVVAKASIGTAVAKEQIDAHDRTLVTG
jgi:hypothetical protein